MWWVFLSCSASILAGVAWQLRLLAGRLARLLPGLVAIGLETSGGNWHQGAVSLPKIAQRQALAL